MTEKQKTYLGFRESHARIRQCGGSKVYVSITLLRTRLFPAIPKEKVRKKFDKFIKRKAGIGSIACAWVKLTEVCELERELLGEK